MIRETNPEPAGAMLRLLQTCVTRLPRGRGRIARALARHLNRSIIGHVPPFELGIRQIIDTSDPFQVEIWLGAYQPHVVSFLMHNVRPGSRVLCAGLHVGYVAALARRLAGSTGLVLTAEPDSVARSWASRNLELSSGAESARVVVLEGGLSSRNGCIALHRSRVMGHSSFASPHQSTDTEAVMVQRGDEWLRSVGVDSLEVMVLDVEGWETQALKGLSETIEASPELRCLVEVSDWALRDAGSSPDELVTLLSGFGFDVRWATHHGKDHEFGVWGPIVQVTEKLLANDLLCIRSAGSRVGSNG